MDRPLKGTDLICPIPNGDGYWYQKLEHLILLNPAVHRYNHWTVLIFLNTLFLCRSAETERTRLR
ncbi:MAG: hypothetical protein LBQ77_04180 [Treponema sp.]|nr:hypothetical protein [Treponema sp.]